MIEYAATGCRSVGFESPSRRSESHDPEGPIEEEPAMDTAIEPVRKLSSKEFNRATDTRDMLARAGRQREAYNLDD